MAVYTLPKHLHPDFASGRKPVGGVEVDRDNWAGKELVYGTIFSRGAPIDVVSGMLGTTTGTAGPVADYFTYDGIDGKTVTTYQDVPDEWTYLIMFYPNDAAGTDNRYPMVMKDCLECTWEHSNAAFRAAVVTQDSGGYHAAHHNAVQSEWNHVAGSFDGATLKAYLGGVLQTTNTDPVGVSITPTAPMQFGRSTSGSTGPWSGNIKHCLLFKKLFSDAQIAELSADPYQTLKPAVPISYFTAAAAGFEPQWARHSNIILGSH